jgi:5-carboxymethyl-2-hydroxymuconate isomerase
MNISSFEETAHASRTLLFITLKNMFRPSWSEKYLQLSITQNPLYKNGACKKNFVKAMIQEAQVSTTSR